MNFIGRHELSEKLKELLLKSNSGKSFQIQSIEGPGGIGKTSLVTHVIDKIDLAPRKYITLSINGNEISHLSAISAVEHILQGAESNLPLPKIASSYFTRSTEIISMYRKLISEVLAEAKNTNNQECKPGEIQYFLNYITNLGVLTNQILPQTKSYINFSALEQRAPHLISFYKESKVLLPESPSWFEKLGVGSKAATRNAIRQDPLTAISTALVGDLNSILSTYELTEAHKPSQSKLKEVDRLLLIIDDYETTKNTLQQLLIGSLLTRLSKAKFESVVIIIGRDDIGNTHAAWKQNFSKFMSPAIKLNPLTRVEMDAMIDGLAYIDSSEKARAWKDTDGYPYLVELWMEEYREGGRTGTILHQFHNRTTRWMDEDQKKWLKFAVMIEGSLNGNSFKPFLESQEASKAWDWFKGEGSIRGSNYEIKEFIRSRLKDFLKIDDPALYTKIQEILK